MGGYPAGVSRRAQIVAVIAVVAGLFVADRAAVVASGAHLLFHPDRAEYAYYGALAYSLDQPTATLIGAPARRKVHLARCAAVGDMGLHGTTAIAGTALHAALVHGGADVSTWTLKRLAIGFSTIALLLWLLLLARAWRSPGALAVFGALIVLAPLPLVKLNVLFWGTHELVLLLLAAGLLGIGGWIANGPAPTSSRAAGRAALFGAGAAVAFGLNFSLLLPAGFAAVWLVGAEPDARRRAAGAAIGLAAFAAVWALIATRPSLEPLGYTLAPWSNPRVEEVGQRWYGPISWGRALAVAPGLIPGLVAALWLAVAPSEDPEALERHPLTRFLAAYLAVGFVVTAALPMGWLTGDGPAMFQHRYVGPLYPVSAAVVAAWAASRSRRVGGAVVIVLLGIGAVGQLAPQQATNFGVASRYDGARLYCHLRGEDCRDLPLERFRMGGASPAFLDGFALLTRHQKLEQLAWIDRTELSEVLPEAVAMGWIADGWSMGSDADREQFLLGVGYAMRLLHPPPEVGRLDGLWPQLGVEAATVQRGYDLPATSLEFGGR